jgi:hypothetical protein
MDGGLPDVAQTDVAGTDVAGTDVAGTDVAGTDVAGTDVAGTDVAGTDVAGTDVATGADMSDGPTGGDGAGTDGGSADAMFSCGPCGINWSCGGAAGTPYTYVMLVAEDDGCYLSGLPGHKLLAADGTITENGVSVARAQRFGPQVGLYYPDGSQWLYCGGVLPCTTQ